MLNRLIVLLLMSLAVWGQNPNTAAFPAAPAADTDLLVASNRATTNLNGSITSGATTINVTSTALFIVPTVITIES